MIRFPLDKNWIKNFTIMEMKYGGHQVQDFLNEFPDDEMPDDVKACRDTRNAWKVYDYLPVRNFRSFAVAVDMLIQQSQYRHYKILMGSQLRNRVLYDKNSSQRISATILTMNDSALEDRLLQNKNLFELSPHLRNAITIKKMFADKDTRNRVKLMIYKEDETIKKQFNYFITKLCGENFRLKVDSAEDVPLAVAMGEMTLEDAEEQYPQLRHHETDRIKELKSAFKGQYNETNDHRIMMARAMKDVIDEKHYYLDVIKPEVVNKSFPKFWDMIKDIRWTYK